MNKNQLVVIWSWLVLSILIEVISATYLSSAYWALRGGIESLIALSAVIPLILFYMGLWNDHISLKMFVVCSLFFCADLILIWSASSVH
jgi:hypothetical protein